jgi:hypothetical protein
MHKDYFSMFADGLTSGLRGKLPEEIRQSLVKYRGALQAHLDELQAEAARIESNPHLTTIGKQAKVAEETTKTREALTKALGGGWKATIAALQAERDRPEERGLSKVGQLMEAMRQGETRRQFTAMVGTDKLKALTLLQTGDVDLLEAIAAAPSFVRDALLPPEGQALVDGAKAVRHRAKYPARAALLDDVTQAQAALDDLVAAAGEEIGSYDTAPVADRLALVAAGESADEPAVAAPNGEDLTTEAGRLAYVIAASKAALQGPAEDAA